MLFDSFHRQHTYLRVSLTDKCNLACSYCMPQQKITHLRHEDVLRNEEFIKLISLFKHLGIQKVRFTGGEPLLRKNAIHIFSEIRKLFPDLELCLTTNGTLLAEHLDDLYTIGIHNINISLDTLSRSRYISLTGKDHLDTVLQVIEKIQQYAGFNLKINTVLMQETLNELDMLIEYAKDRKLTVRFIEKMPLHFSATEHSFITEQQLIRALHKKGQLLATPHNNTPVAAMYRYLYKGTHPISLGIISPLTHTFCPSCNRLRLTCDGTLKTCLLRKSSCNIKDAFRSGASDASLTSIIHTALHNKHVRHDLEKYTSAAPSSKKQGEEQEDLSMFQIGG